MKNLLQRIKSFAYTKKIITSLLLGTLGGFALFYIFLPPINLQSEGFWVFLAALAALYLLPFVTFEAAVRQKANNASPFGFRKSGTLIRLRPKLMIPILVPIVILLVGLGISSTLFNAKRYAAVIEVTEYDFATDMKETQEITHIALMDTASARMLGNRTLGSLSDVVSQFTVSEAYTQINYQNKPKKVTNLEYDGFFKWLGNRETGIPGYVMVDPVESSAEYQKLQNAIIYAESAYFGDDLERKLRFDYPTKIFNSISFEIDEAGNPYYIVSCSRPTVALFGASDVSEVIIFDPTNGDSQLCTLAEVPTWIDIVYTGDLACQKFNWHGTLAGGFINSIIGNVDCKHATDDFGYIALNDDVWYFTGVTSAVSDDKSNIGFILTNARTGEYKFYPVIGAEEHSAMSAAQGEVQEKGYVAAFPSLVNIAGEATYIMVLKDDAGLVKLYALVNVENYSIVTTGQTQTEAMNAYKKLLRENGVETSTPTTDELTATITVESLRDVSVAGNTYVYLSNGTALYKAAVQDDESILLVKPGDVISVTYEKSDVEGIFTVKQWRFQ